MFFKPHLWPLAFALVIVLVLPLLAGYVVLLERKVMADMQARLGPMRVGPHGLLQPLADAVKLLMKEDIIPENADKWIFWLAPLLSVTAGMVAMAALPIGPVFLIANLNVGLLFILGIGSMGIFGIVLGGWASNSHYSLLGALRSAAQLVSYETAAGMAVVSGVILGGSLNTTVLVNTQAEQHVWFIFVAPIGFFLYLVASIAETNRAPFDLPEAESELVAGYMTEYSGFRWALYFLAEYTNMIVVASIATTLFLGGWLRPFAGTKAFNFLDYVPMLLMLLVAGYSLYRAPKQPVPVQKMVMVGVAGLCLRTRRNSRRARFHQDGNDRRHDARSSRRILVPVQSWNLSLRFPVAAFHFPALQIRSAHETRLAFPDSRFHRQCFRRRHCQLSASQ